MNDSDERLGKKEAAARLQLEFPRLQSNGNSDLFSHRVGTCCMQYRGVKVDVEAIFRNLRIILEINIVTM